MLRTPPKDSEPGNMSQAQSEPNIPAVLAETQTMANVSVRQKRPRTAYSLDADHHQLITNDLLDTIRQEIRSVLPSEISINIKHCISTEFAEIRELCRGLKETVNFMSDEFDRMKTELDSCKKNNNYLHKENEIL